MDSIIPPESLTNLIKNLEYLGGIPDEHKYCFTTRTYVTNSWFYYP